MQAILLHFTRWGLANAGAAIAAHGWLTNDQSSQLVGAVITAVPLIWGAVHNYSQDQKVKANAIPTAARTV